MPQEDPDSLLGWQEIQLCERPALQALAATRGSGTPMPQMPADRSLG
jgi:hypothetical protein